MRFRSLALLTLRGISGGAFRSWVIGFCAFVIAAFALCTVIVVGSARSSLDLMQNRLGADLLVVAKGAESEVEGALLMGQSSTTGMPRSYVDVVAAIEGVEAASPQLYVGSLFNTPLSSTGNMQIVAYDPKTDFAVSPWLEQELGTGLRLGEAVAGTYIQSPTGTRDIEPYGYPLTIAATLEPTGGNLDNAVFVTFETASDMIKASKNGGQKPLTESDGTVSSILVRLAPGADATRVAGEIANKVPDVTAIQSSELFGSFRAQISGVLRGMGLVLGLSMGVSLILIGVVFSLAVNERRKQIGVLRALGARRTPVVLSLLSESIILALPGSILGVTLGSVGVYLLRGRLASSLGSFAFPSAGRLSVLIVVGLVLALVCAALAAALPALRISRQEPAVSMRE